MAEGMYINFHTSALKRFVVFALVGVMLAGVFAASVTASGSAEIVPSSFGVSAPTIGNLQSEWVEVGRGRDYVTYRNGLTGEYRARIYSGPIHTWDGSQWVSYVFENKGDYYQVKHPVASARFYPDHTTFFDENFSEALVSDERWAVEYLSGRWSDAEVKNVRLSYEIVSENEIKIVRTGETSVGVLKQIYKFTEGSPVKIELELTASRDIQARFVWKLGGIAAANDATGQSRKNDNALVESSMTFLDGENKPIACLAWHDEVDTVNEISASSSSLMDGRAAEIKFGVFNLRAGERAVLDPTVQINPSLDGSIHYYDDYYEGWKYFVDDYSSIFSAGTSEGGGMEPGYYRGYLRFNISNLLGVTQINSATLNAYLSSVYWSGMGGTGCLLQNIDDIGDSLDVGDWNKNTRPWGDLGAFTGVVLSIGYWPLEGYFGNDVYDVSDHGNDGTVYGATSVSGKVGNYALSFDGQNDYIEVPDSASLDITDTLTMEAWVKLSNPSADQKIVGKVYLTGDLAGYGYVMGVGSNKLYAEIFDSNQNRYMFQAGTINPNVWTHIAVTWQKGGRMIGYINGSEVANIAASSNPIGTNSNPLRIGCAPWDTTQFLVNGVIDDVCVYARALIQEEIQEHVKGDDAGRKSKNVTNTVITEVGIPSTYMSFRLKSDLEDPDLNFIGRRCVFNSMEASSDKPYLEVTYVPGPPTAPTSLKATSGIGQVTLNWDKPISDGGLEITNYRIYRGTSPGGETPLTTIGVQSSYIDTDVVNGQTYYYQVSAINSVGEGVRSSEVSAMPQGPPTAPMNLVALAGDVQVQLSWNQPASSEGSPITNYKIYKGTSPGGETYYTTVGASPRIYVDTDVVNYTTYYYKVSAVNAIGEGPLSNEADATPSYFNFELFKSKDIAMDLGSSDYSMITVSLYFGTPELVTLSGSWQGSAPSGVTMSFNPGSGTPTFTSTLTATATLGASPGTFTYRATGTWGILTDDVDVSVTVTDPYPPPAPQVWSTTHPNSTIWYQNSNPSFSWAPPSDPSGISGYSYVFNQIQSTTPDTISEGTATSKSYTNNPDGEYWFHVRACDGPGNWGDTTHFKVRINTISVESRYSGFFMTDVGIVNTYRFYPPSTQPQTASVKFVMTGNHTEEIVDTNSSDGWTAQFNMGGFGPSPELRVEAYNGSSLIFGPYVSHPKTYQTPDWLQMMFDSSSVVPTERMRSGLLCWATRLEVEFDDWLEEYNSDLFGLLTDFDQFDVDMDYVGGSYGFNMRSFKFCFEIVSDMEDQCISFSGGGKFMEAKIAGQDVEFWINVGSSFNINSDTCTIDWNGMSISIEGSADIRRWWPVVWYIIPGYVGVNVSPHADLEFTLPQLGVSHSIGCEVLGEAFATVGVVSGRLSVGGDVTWYALPVDFNPYLSIQMLARGEAWFLFWKVWEAEWRYELVKIGGGIKFDGSEGLVSYDENENMWVPIDRYYAGPDYSQFAWTPGMESGTLVRNIYPSAKPSVVVDESGNMMAVWAYDNIEKNLWQAFDIQYSRYNSSTKTWSEPTPILNDYLLDFSPVLTSDDDGNVIAVWTRVPSELDEDTPPLEALGSAELVYSVWSPSTMTWSVPVEFTDDEYLNIMPSTAKSGGSVMLAYVLDNDSNPLTFENNDMWCTRWTGSGWSTPELVADNVSVISEPAFTLTDEDSGVLAFARDLDDNVTTIDDRDIFYVELTNNSWGEVQRLTDDSKGDSYPSVNYIDEVAHLTWIKENVAIGDNFVDVIYESEVGIRGEGVNSRDGIPSSVVISKPNIAYQKLFDIGENHYLIYQTMDNDAPHLLRLEGENWAEATRFDDNVYYNQLAVDTNNGHFGILAVKTRFVPENGENLTRMYSDIWVSTDITPPTIESFTIEPTIISPNGDGIMDNATIAANLTEDSEWILTINKNDGEIVRTFNGSGTSIYQIWDGKLENGELPPDGTYTVYLDVTDQGGNFVDTSTDITLDDTPAPIPFLLSPTNNTIGDDNTPTFNWSSVTDSSGVTYTLQYSTNYTFQNATTIESLLDNTYTVPDEDALLKKTYYWRVLAVDGSGNQSDWSEVWRFTIERIITTVEELQAMSADLTAYYVLGNDIDASVTQTWNDDGAGGYYGFEPIGTDVTPFMGSFDGQGYRIINLYINRPDTGPVGLFGFVGSGGVVKNVGLEDANVSGDSCVGGLVGYNYGGTVSNSYSTGYVSGTDFVGGFVGYHIGIVSNCYSTSSVSGNEFVGGFVGFNAQSFLSNCYSTGPVIGNKRVGGFIGDSDGEVSDCYSTGDVSGNDYVGGFIGNNGMGAVYNSYSTGYVVGSSNVGGFAGSDWYHDVFNSFWDIETSGQTWSDGGTGKTTVEMQDVRTFTDTTWSAGLTTPWDFIGNPYEDEGAEDIWNIDPLVNDGYPFHLCIITTVEELQAMNNNPNGHYVLGNDIDASVTQTWNEDPENPGTYFGFEPIGTDVTPFTGSFDGGGYKIYNLYINRPDTNYISLFGYVGSGGVVEDVGLEDVNASGYYAVGGLVGWNEGAVSDSYSTGFVSGDYAVIGGVAGFNAGTVSKCYSTGSISGGSHYVGGVVGYNTGIVSDSYSTGSVSCDYCYAGGLVGYNYSSGTVTNCHSTGTVSGVYDVGGLVGWNEGTVTDSYSTGSVSCEDRAAGGIVGYNYSSGTVSRSYFTGSVNCNNSAGGIAGRNTGTVSNCYSTGSVSGSWAAGGLVGGNWGDISNSYSTGFVSGDDYVGGLIGYGDAGTVTNSFWDNQTSGQTTSAGGAGKTTENMKDVRTFTDPTWSTGLITPWDFVNDPYYDEGTEDIWNIHPAVNNGYPFPTALITQPYIIRTVEDLQAMSADLTAYYVLGNDIDASVTQTWNDDGAGGYYGFEPIGTDVTPFMGSFDGQGYKIYNLYINRPDTSYVGLFGFVGGMAVVKNVGLVNANISGSFGVGGLVGNNWGNVTNSYSTSSVSGGTNVGGLVGRNHGIVSNSYSTGSVTGDSDVGGLIGCNTEAQEVSNSYSTGSVSGDDEVGGLVGANSGTVSKCYSAGSVDGNSVVGGLIGYNYGSGTVSRSYSTGPVSGSGWAVGGLVGYNSIVGTVFNCYSTGSVSGFDVGGLVGWNEATVSNSFWDIETSGQTWSDGGTGKTTVEMQDVRTFTDTTWSAGLTTPWDFIGNPYEDEGTEDIWDIYPAVNDGYPFLTVLKEKMEGSGNSEDPYIIKTLEHLQSMKYNLSAYYALGNDIDASGTVNWNDGAGFEPIGYYDYNEWVEFPFIGSFDGRGYKIYNLYINRPDVGYVSLFGIVRTGGVVKNVGLESEDVNGLLWVGGLVGWNEGAVSNSYSTGSVSGDDSVGGLIGVNEGTVTNSYSRCSVGSWGFRREIAGFISFNAGTVVNCYSTGFVDGDDVGGFIWWGGGTVSNSFWDIQTSGWSISFGGAGKTTAEMKDVRTFTDTTWSAGLTTPWDFVGNPYEDVGTEDIWNIDPLVNGGYPFLTTLGAQSSFGYTTPGAFSDWLEGWPLGNIRGSKFVCPYSGTANSITAYIDVAHEAGIRFAIYNEDLSLLAQTDSTFLLESEDWVTLSFASPPSLTAYQTYWLVVFGASQDTVTMSYDAGATNQGLEKLDVEWGDFPDPLAPTAYADKKYSIYCTYTPTF